jgi:hypothetical protein
VKNIFAYFSLQGSTNKAFTANQVNGWHVSEAWSVPVKVAIS